MLTVKTCQDCGGEYRGGPLARFCPDCRKKHVGDSARRRRLCDIGAGARWNPKKDTEGLREVPEGYARRHMPSIFAASPLQKEGK